MNSLIRGLHQSSRMVASVSLAALLTASFPVASFAQDGVVARGQQPTQQQPKPPETPPTPRRDAPAPDIQKMRERQEEKGEIRKNDPIEREKRNVPAPGDVTPAPSVQTQQTETPAGQNPITQPLTLSPEIGKQRVGVIEGQQQLLTLQDAIALSLQNNLDIEAFRQSVQIAQYNLFASRGVYDIVSGTELNYQSRTIPVASVFAGGDSSGSVSSKTLTYNFNTSQLVERTGASWRVDFDNNRTTTSSTASTLTPQYNPSLSFSFTQPLMRNFRIDQNRRTIELLRQSLDLSDSQFRQRVIEIINLVQRAYWDLVFARRNEQIARESVELTRTQLENNQKQVEAGTIAPIDLRETEAALESRKGDVIFALQNITTAENVLKGLLSKDPNDKFWNSEIVPTDEPQFGQTTFSLEDATRLALRNRPELDQMRLQQEQNQVNVKFFKNQLKPQVDLVGFYTSTGLAGTPALTVDPITGQPIARQVGERFQGAYFQSLKNLFGQDFKVYQVGVSVSIPWRNRTAEGNLGRTLAEGRQLDARQRQLVQTVQIDVRNALQNVEAARQRYEVARSARTASEAQLAGEQEKFRAGLSTNFLVLTRQTDLSVARGTEVRALTDYNKALADLQRVTGMTLVSNNVQVASPMSEGKK
ncbi:MAG TPA: TolC family protein [Blastocatellia bacterium]